MVRSKGRNNRKRTDDGRKLNLVIHGVQENEQDLHDVKQMMATCLELDVISEKVTRLGQPDHTKSRLILAVKNNMNDKKKILSKGKEIRNSTEEKYKTVFIIPDLTPRQRANSKQLTGPSDAEMRRQP